MSYIPELHYCQVCHVYLGPDNGDGLCLLHDSWPPRDENGRFRKWDSAEIVYSKARINE